MASPISRTQGKRLLFGGASLSGLVVAIFFYQAEAPPNRTSTSADLLVGVKAIAASKGGWCKQAWLYEYESTVTSPVMPEQRTRKTFWYTPVSQAHGQIRARIEAKGAADGAAITLLANSNGWENEPLHTDFRDPNEGVALINILANANLRPWPAQMLSAGNSKIVEETDAVGRVIARLRPDGHKTWTKTRIRYQHPSAPTILASRVSFSLDDNRLPVVIEGSEIITYEGEEASQTKIAFKLVRAAGKPNTCQTASPKGNADVNRLKKFTPNGDLVRAVIGLAREKMGQAHVERYSEYVRNLIDNEEPAKTTGYLTAALDHEGELAYNLEDLFLSNPGDESLRERIIGIVTGSKSQAAQEVAGRIIAELSRDDEAPDLLEKAVISQGLAPEPISENYEILWQLASRDGDERLRNVAALALGGNLYRELDDQIRQIYLTKIVGLLATNNDTTIVSMLDALGNAGDARALPAIREYLASSNEYVAERALYSLRHMRGADVSQALLQVVLHTPHEEHAMQALNQLVNQTTSESFRKSAVSRLESKGTPELHEYAQKMLLNRSSANRSSASSM